MKTLITSALPYANGSIHIGHLVEYLQTDIYVRFLKMTGHDAIYMCADDTHGTPIMMKAKSLGITPEELITRYNIEHQRDFADFHIHFDHYYSTNSPENRKHATTIYQRLKDSGFIVTKEVEGYYCETDQMFLSDRFVKGICPECGTADQYGDVCESCGKHYDPVDLVSPRCATCGSAPIRRLSKHYFFQLSAFADRLKEWTSTAGRLQPETLNSINTWLNSGLHDWDISRDAPYFGFKIPGEEDKYFYVWLDAPVGYIATTENYCVTKGLNFEDYWHNPDTEIIHFIGKDIVYFHTLFWPAMLMGSGYTVPKQVCVHGFLTVNGEKMSKTRGTFINARTYLNHLDPQYLRYYYAAKLTGSADDIDLNLEDFIAKVNADLVNNIVNLASRAAKLLNQNFNSEIALLGSEEEKLLQSFFAGTERIRENYKSREFARTLRLIVEISTTANKYFSDQAPWKLLMQDRHQTHVLCSFAMQSFKFIITLLKPVLPQLAMDAEAILNLPPQTWDDAIQPLPVGHRISEFRRLLERVEMQRVSAMVAETKSELSPSEPKMETVRSTQISYGEFKQVDIRVGLILAVDNVAESQTLYKLEIDVGKRVTVYANIRSSYPIPHKLIGKRVAVVVNLPPKVFKRIGTSEAMILAAEGDDGTIVLPEFSEATKPGCRLV